MKPLSLLVILLAGLAWAGSRLRLSASEPPGNPGYAAFFQTELEKIGQISPPQFAKRYGIKGSYLPRLTWDPTTAKFWDQFNSDPYPQAKQGAYAPGFPVHRFGGKRDYRLSADELAKFKHNGFMVSSRLGAPTCANVYFQVYQRDLPVFITTDSILHAWHRSYDAMLEEIEIDRLTPALREILTDMVAEIPQARRDYGQGLCADSLPDADYFLTVARCLLAGNPVKSALEQEARVAQTLQACDRLQLQKFDLFGKLRWVDFSQFKPRGHYEKTEHLKQYFRAMMWCGRIDLRVAGNPQESSPRELAAAIVLHDLLQRSGKFERWQQFDRLLQTFVGKPDSMTFGQLGAVLAAAGIRSPADVKDPAQLAALQARIESSKFGKQEIRGDVFVVSPYNPHRLVLPRSFTFLGQRFAVDSWITAKTVFDDVAWDGKKVMRRIPSSLDVAFAALGNDHTVQALVQRLTDPVGRKFRDGLNYQHNLAATREVIDRQPETMWQENLYTGWLGSLRELSRPTIDANYPEAMRTNAWAMKTLNTQLASWTQLRHDTLLYVKQSYTSNAACEYPAGYVEPVPHFWRRLEQLSRQAADQLDASLVDRGSNQVHFLRRFAGTVATLGGIAEKELAQKALSALETKFLKDVVEIQHFPSSSKYPRKPPEYKGWYPSLFYRGVADCEEWDPLVADVHTNPPDQVAGDPGCVLHQGVGNVDLLMIAIDNGKDRMVYAGPVLSHYEFEMAGVSRKSDSEWKADLQARRIPPRPPWTQGYLIVDQQPQQQSGTANPLGNYYWPPKR